MIPDVCPQLRYWEQAETQETASVVRTVGNRASAILRELDGSSTYLIRVRAYNSAGVGPDSAVVNITTKKPRESTPPH